MFYPVRESARHSNKDRLPRFAPARKNKAWPVTTIRSGDNARCGTVVLNARGAKYHGPGGSPTVGQQSKGDAEEERPIHWAEHLLRTSQMLGGSSRQPMPVEKVRGLTRGGGLGSEGHYDSEPPGPKGRCQRSPHGEMIRGMPYEQT